MVPGIESRLASLDAHPGPAVERFDAGSAMAGRLAFLPSAFNPPTVAHLHLLEAALHVDGVTRVAAMLTTRNVAKGVVGASLADRVSMLLALHREQPSIAVLAANAARIIDQAQALSVRFDGLGVDVIVGFDTLERLFDPLYYTDMERELSGFFDQHRVIAANRGERAVHDVHGWVAEHASEFAGRILVREIDPYPASLSSTMARQAASGGTDALPVPPSVRRYIETHGLYSPRTT